MPVRKPIDIKKGYIIKVGRDYYEILSEEKLLYKYEKGTVASAGESTNNIEKLQAPDDYLYWINEISQDGLCSFRLQVPRGTPRGGPLASAEQWITPEMAHRLNPYECSLWLKPKSVYPAIVIKNESDYSCSCNIIFEGIKFKIRKRNDIPAVFMDVSDYSSVES